MTRSMFGFGGGARSSARAPASTSGGYCVTIGQGRCEIGAGAQPLIQAVALSSASTGIRIMLNRFLLLRRLHGILVVGVLLRVVPKPPEAQHHHEDDEEKDDDGREQLAEHRGREEVHRQPASLRPASRCSASQGGSAGRPSTRRTVSAITSIMGMSRGSGIGCVGATFSALQTASM